ncbi:MAG: hypothetical protein WC975_08635 [Phycisphaerae bacterium]
MDIKQASEIFRGFRERLSRLLTDPTAVPTPDDGERTLKRMGITAAILYRKLADKHIPGFDLTLCQPQLTDNPSQDNELWWMTWQMITTALSHTHPDQLPPSFGDIKETEIMSDVKEGIRVCTGEYPPERWKQRIEDHIQALSLMENNLDDLNRRVQAAMEEIFNVNLDDPLHDKMIHQPCCLEFLRQYCQTYLEAARKIILAPTDGLANAIVDSPHFLEYFHKVKEVLCQAAGGNGRNVDTTPIRQFDKAISDYFKHPKDSTAIHKCYQQVEITLNVLSDRIGAEIANLPTGSKSEPQTPARRNEEAIKGNTEATHKSFIAVDDIDTFAKVKDISKNFEAELPVKNSEADIKELFHKILGEPFKQKDWGGEQNDIFTTRVEIGGKRHCAAFMLKGPATPEPLTIAKCGKNGDQIQRLFKSPADLFVIQFHGKVSQEVVEECKQKVQLLRTTTNPNAIFTIIDGKDTARLIKAYT